MSRKRIPLNQNGCTANFRIGVPFGQNLQGLAYQLYCYENSYVRNDIHSDATRLWKEICVGEKSSDEFSEVKNEWGYERS